MKNQNVAQKDNSNPNGLESAFDTEKEGKSMSPPSFQLKASTSEAPSPPASQSSSGGLSAELVNGFQASTGHDLSDVKVHRNSGKPKDLGALAYAQGNEIHLGSGQEKHLAHEAAHIVQQREGQVKANTQVAGKPVNSETSLETGADQMGAKAMQMKSAKVEAGHGKKSGGSGTAAVQRKASYSGTNVVAQLYAEVDVAAQTPRNWNAGENLRVADNGKTATSEDHGSKKAYAHPSLIAQSNRELAARNSGIVLEEQAETISGRVPSGQGRHTLKRVMPTIAHSGNGGVGTGQDSWADCGRMSREVMGNGGADQSPHGVIEGGSGELEETSRTSRPSTHRDNALIAAGLGPDAATALAAYRAMSDVDREAFDEAHQLNRFAAPSVGEAFSTDDANGFNFHWGGVVFTPGGGDRVTLENFYKGGTYDSQDNGWYFETYGPPSKVGQTWDEQWDNAGGDTFTVRTSTRSLTGTTNTAGVRFVDNPRNWDDSAHYSLLDNATQVQKLSTNESNWIQVEVKSGPMNGQTGYIMSHYFTGN